MNKKNVFLFLIFISCLSFETYSKRCGKGNICPNNFNYFLEKNSINIPSNSPQFKDNLRYYQSDKIIETSFDKLKLKLNFNCIHQSKTENPDENFLVSFTLNFYDKATIGIDEINAVLDWETPLYSYSLAKKGEETKGKIDWEVDIKPNEEKEQIVQLIANASLGNITEVYIYNSFRFTYKAKKEEEKEEEKKEEKVDNSFTFWIIFFAYVGATIITFIVMYVIFYATIEIGRNTLALNNISTGFEESTSSQDRETKPEVSRTTA